MDWSKAKNILIVIFLALNIILLFTNYDTLSSSGNTSKEILSDTTGIMGSRGVKLNCKIPENSEMVMLTLKNTQYDKAEIVGKLLDKKVTNNNIVDGTGIYNKNKSLVFKDKGFIYIDDDPKGNGNVLNASDAEKVLDKLLKKFDAPFSEYILDKHTKNKNNSFELEYIHKYKGYFVFDDYIKATISSKGLTRLEFVYREVKGIEQNKGKRIIEAYQVLIEADDIRDTSIKSIDIGFKKDATDKDTINPFEVLSWRIVLNNGSDRYFSALNGKAIS